jgi:hypothetical protein
LAAGAFVTGAPAFLSAGLAAGFGAAFAFLGAGPRDGGAFDFRAAAFDPLAFGFGEEDVFDFFGLVRAIGPGFDQAISSGLTPKIVSN